jgi:pimeloyl-ACP methyl ester carboxylesterase
MKTLMLFSMKTLLYISVILCCLMLAGSLYHWIATKNDQSKFPPVGNLIDIGGYLLHIHCMGTGKETVVLDAGLGLNSLEWTLVQPKIAAFTRVCSYDRAGYGWSDESPLPRTSEHIAHELHTLLTRAQIPKPFILVGHSIGGLYMQQYASLYPEEVAGLILVDSCHEDQSTKLPQEPPKGKLATLLLSPRLTTFLTSIGVGRLFSALPPIKKLCAEKFRAFPETIQQAYAATTNFSKVIRTVHEENSLFDVSAAQVKKTHFFLGEKPLIVITAGKSDTAIAIGPSQRWLDEVYQSWTVLQSDLITRSKQGKQLIAERSDHAIPRNQPELIVEAVRDLILKR